MATPPHHLSTTVTSSGPTTRDGMGLPKENIPILEALHRNWISTPAGMMARPPPRRLPADSNGGRACGTPPQQAEVFLQFTLTHRDETVLRWPGDGQSKPLCSSSESARSPTADGRRRRSLFSRSAHSLLRTSGPLHLRRVEAATPSAVWLLAEHPRAAEAAAC